MIKTFVASSWLRLIGSILVVIVITACNSSVLTSENSTPTSYVAIAENALSGGMKIVAVDDVPVGESNGVDLPSGEHKISVACKLDNGISTTFAFDVKLLPNHSYCFFSQNQGKSCNIVYTQIDWQGGGSVSCR